MEAALVAFAVEEAVPLTLGEPYITAGLAGGNGGHDEIAEEELILDLSCGGIAADQGRCVQRLLMTRN